ncbi:unnamed protein product [Soboliphyme baturini]|uniref:Secreted protein n=1 Tax=Soboliphyme baturini TaxID=241478 RepID=A0A183ICA5_9BILA|nr:unnamed protein product [Soboliphyme baturini]
MIGCFSTSVFSGQFLFFSGSIDARRKVVQTPTGYHRRPAGLIGRIVWVGAALLSTQLKVPCPPSPNPASSRPPFHRAAVSASSAHRFPPSCHNLHEFVWCSFSVIIVLDGRSVNGCQRREPRQAR